MIEMKMSVENQYFTGLFMHYNIQCNCMCYDYANKFKKKIAGLHFLLLLNVFPYEL